MAPPRNLLRPPNYIVTRRQQQCWSQCTVQPTHGICKGETGLRESLLEIDVYTLWKDTIRPSSASAPRHGGSKGLIPIVLSSNEPRWGNGRTEEPRGGSKSKIGVLAGGVLGGVAATLILAGVVYWWLRKRGSSGGVPPTWPGIRK